MIALQRVIFTVRNRAFSSFCFLIAGITLKNKNWSEYLFFPWFIAFLAISAKSAFFRFSNIESYYFLKLRNCNSIPFVVWIEKKWFIDGHCLVMSPSFSCVREEDEEKVWVWSVGTWAIRHRCNTSSVVQRLSDRLSVNGS